MSGLVFTGIARRAMKAGKVPGRPDSRQWFRDVAQEVQRVNVDRLMMNPRTKSQAEILPGKMYCFFYDPKHKDTLPYYDRFPLIFPIGIEGDSMLGINLHYLPHDMRARLMDALYDLEDKRFTKQRKLRLSYEILKGAARFRYFKPCIKRYLFSHMRSRFLEVEHENWDVALMLPLERFEKQSKSVVWKESRQTQ
jgi:hypothetical protein